MIIPNGEVLFRYADPNVFPLGQVELPISIFNDANMSCDWKHHQPAPQTSLHVAQGRRMIVSILICDAIRQPANPKRIGAVVPAWFQDIFHDPLQADPVNPYTPNQSHSLIRGAKKGAVTTAIRDNSTYQIV